MSDVYIVEDMEQFVEACRVLVFSVFGENNAENKMVFSKSELPQPELEELEQILTQKESLILAKEYIRTQTHKFTKKQRYIISEKKCQEFVECLNSRMVSNLLNKLTNEGLVDTSFDSDLNDFVFWVKE